MDVPNARSSHVAPTPRGGGIACLVGMGAGLLAARASGSTVPLVSSMGVAALAAVGFVDDRRGLPAAQRLAAQAGVGAVVGAAQGGATAALVGSVLVPAVVNSFNFMDGINGISGGEVIVWSSFAGLGDRASTAPGVHATAGSMLGAALTFLPWNVPRAKVFLGDVGSYSFGAGVALSMLSAWTQQRGSIHRLSAPYLVYIADTGWTLVRRARRGARLTEAHREHVYQQLVDVDGVQHWHVSALVASSSVVCGSLARSRAGSLLIPVVLAGYLASPRLLRTAGARE